MGLRLSFLLRADRAVCPDYPPGELPALWEAQAASLKIPKTGMVVVTDLVDNLRDIHPIDKIDVGKRLGPLGPGQGVRPRKASSTPARSTSACRLKATRFASGLPMWAGG